ncbi:hypothetical protein CAL26_10035 [Bordetella genomosp. 9]|uniref:Acyltransferase 3 domain-containing protein n=1 Tax=Bordetella genomosp. 9 TaxID=1416803 RepID=A0A261RGK4_9BORD|nr:acyltransferase [Bordetella genomosp. 9]OZI23760.1 hypothetical protein CAL26_10035 [Bordetella genomosp. 9]
MKNLPELRALTSLRFVAAALIVAIHAGVFLDVARIPGWFPAQQGVSFFFVLSGFILAYNHRGFDTPGSVANFYTARFARIWPMHIATLVIWIALVYKMSLDSVLWGNGAVRLPATVLLLQTWVPIKGWGDTYNGVAWSISVELFFYLLFPFLVTHMRRNWPSIVLACVATVAVLIWACRFASLDGHTLLSYAGLLYFFPPARLLEFVVGIGAFYLVRGSLGRVKTPASLGWTCLEMAALVGTVAAMIWSVSNPFTRAIGPAAAFYIGAAGAAPAFAVLIGVFAMNRGYVSALLSTRVLVYLGKISFALYLVHYAIVVAISQQPQLLSLGWWAYGAAWVLSLAAAAALFHLVEEPARRALRRRIVFTAKSPRSAVTSPVES